MARPRRSRDPLEVALRALRVRDHSATSLDARLESRGFEAHERGRTIARLQDLGYVDDARYAYARAATLASRGAGDLRIADDLERSGVGPDLIADALAALAPEPERARAIVDRRGVSAQTARHLASQGFTEEAVEAVVAGLAEDALG